MSRRVAGSGYVLPLLLAVVLGASVPAFLLRVRAMGFRIPQPDIEWDYLIGVVWAIVLGLSILLWPVPARDRRALLVIWALKSIVVLGFMLVYEWFYGLDAFSYFGESLHPYLPVEGTGWGRGTENTYALAWWHGRVLPGSYHAMKTSFSMTGLVSVYLVYRGAVRFLGRDDLRLLYLLALYPSILFWSSTLGKDPIQLLGVALYAYGVMSWRVTGRSRYAIPVALGILVSAWIRIWSGVILVVPLALFVLIGLKGVFSRVIFFAATVATLLWAGDMLSARFQLDTVEDLYTRADLLTQGWQGGSAQSHDVAFTDMRSMIVFAPIGMFTALFRPLPGEVMNPFGILAGMENLVLLCLLVLAVVRFRWARVLDPLALWAILVVLMWSGLYAFVSFYNMGAAVRFKLQILPLLLCVLLFLAARRDPREVGGTDPREAT